MVTPNRYAKLATCSLNQWAMDFSNNKERILESCRQAKKQVNTNIIGLHLENWTRT